jgi:ArsR family transcriptional regulator
VQHQVTLPQVLHKQADPAAPAAEAARLVAPGGRLQIGHIAPQDLEFLRTEHRHRRLGFTDGEIERWLTGAGLTGFEARGLPPADPGGLTVKIWGAVRDAARVRLIA